MSNMGSNADDARWGEDRAVLAAVGQTLFDQSLKVRVNRDPRVSLDAHREVKAVALTWRT